jgi:hypothetical protein
MRGQAQIVSIIMVIGIIVVLTSATYFWGKPLIDKRVMITQLATLQEFAKRLDVKITEMARSCTGFCDETISVPPGSFVSVYAHDDPGPDNNSIVLEFAINYMMMGNTTVPLNTNVLNEVAPYGETNSVITMRQDLRGYQYIITFKIHYRELDTRAFPKEGYRITLEPEALAGHQRITLSFGGTTVTPDGAANSGPLTETAIKIQTI